MEFRRYVPVGYFLPALALVSLSTGCTTLTKPPASGDLDRAYIEYWPPAQNDSRLRLAVKDLIDIKGTVTTAGSEYVSKNRPPAQQDADCMAIARERNVQLVGKANLTEFAVTVSGRNDYYGTPWNRLGGDRRIPGGSSSGSAVAVANGTADVAFGTDTAGSIRVPAACCGVFGLKTTYGLVPLKGVFALSPDHLDTVGPMAKNVDNLVRGMDLLQRGFVGEYQKAVASKPTGAAIKVGRLYLEGTDPDIDRAIDDSLTKSGFQVVRLPDFFRKQWKDAETDAQRVAVADAWIHDRDYLDKVGVSSKAKAAIVLGRVEYPNNYLKVLSRKGSWQRALNGVLADVDFIALPTMQQSPPKLPWIGRTALFEAQVLALQNTAAVNFAGNPAIAIPVPVANEPVPLTSLQLIGRKRSEAGLVNAARIVDASHRAATQAR